MPDRRPLRTPLLMLISLLAGAAIAAFALRIERATAHGNLLADDPAERAAAFASLAAAQWDDAAIDHLERAALDFFPPLSIELARRLLGHDGPPVDRLSDALRLQLAGDLAALPDTEHHALICDLLGPPLSSIGEEDGARLFLIMQHVLDRAGPRERECSAERVLRCALAQLGLGSARDALFLGGLTAPPHRPDLAQQIDLAAAWRLSPGEGAQRRSADLDPPGPGFASTDAARAARLYRRARALGPDGPLDDPVRRAAETDHPEPALVTLLAAHGGPHAQDLLQALERNDRHSVSAQAARRETAVRRAESILSTARMTVADRAVAVLTILDAQPQRLSERELFTGVLTLDQRDHLDGGSDSVIAAVLLAERTLDGDERAALIAGWLDSFTPATQRAAALLALLSGGPDEPLRALLDASEDPAHRSMLRLTLDGLEARGEPLQGDARNFALRAIRHSAEDRANAWTAHDPFVHDRLAAAAFAGLPEALEALATLPAQPGAGALNRLLLLDRVMPEITELFGGPIHRDEAGIRLWFEAASLWLSMTRHTRTFDPQTRTWSGGLAAL